MNPHPSKKLIITLISNAVNTFYQKFEKEKNLLKNETACPVEHNSLVDPHIQIVLNSKPSLEALHCMDKNELIDKIDKTKGDFCALKKKLKKQKKKRLVHMCEHLTKYYLTVLPEVELIESKYLQSMIQLKRERNLSKMKENVAPISQAGVKRQICIQKRTSECEKKEVKRQKVGKMLPPTMLPKTSVSTNESIHAKLWGNVVNASFNPKQEIIKIIEEEKRFLEMNSQIPHEIFSPPPLEKRQPNPKFLKKLFSNCQELISFLEKQKRAEKLKNVNYRVTQKIEDRTYQRLKQTHMLSDSDCTKSFKWSQIDDYLYWIEWNATAVEKSEFQLYYLS